MHATAEHATAGVSLESFALDHWPFTQWPAVDWSTPTMMSEASPMVQLACAAAHEAPRCGAWAWGSAGPPLAISTMRENSVWLFISVTRGAELCAPPKVRAWDNA